RHARRHRARRIRAVADRFARIGLGRRIHVRRDDVCLRISDRRRPGARSVTHEPFGSLDEMLSIEAISALEQRHVSRIEIEPLQPGFGAASASGCKFLKVRSHAQSGLRDYVVKRSAYATDMVRRLTDDHAGREQLIWQYGVLERLPAEVDSPTLASA